MKLLVICICVCTTIVWARADLNIDDECVLDGTSESGTCKIAHECQRAIDDLDNGCDFTTCGHLDGLEIICCPNPIPTRQYVVTPDRISVQSEFNTKFRISQIFNHI